MKREEILSQEEIDALMQVFSKKASTEPHSYACPEALRRDEATSETQVEHSDFIEDEIEEKDNLKKRIDKNFQKLKKQSKRISELFSHSLVSSLSELLRRDVVLKNSVVEQPLFFEDFFASMNNPSCIGVLTFEMSKITALLELDLNLAYSIIDITLGGSGDNLIKSKRALTDLELKLMRKPMEQILFSLDKALNLKLQLEEVLTYPSSINLNSYHEVVVPFAFDIMPEEYIQNPPTYMITFTLPRIALESQFSNQNTIKIDLKKGDKYLEAIKKSPLIDVPLRLVAQIHSAEITIGKLMEMKIGETIVLGMHKDDDLIEVELSVEGCPKFKGKLGAIGRYKAVEIIEEKLL